MGIYYNNRGFFGGTFSSFDHDLKNPSIVTSVEKEIREARTKRDKKLFEFAGLRPVFQKKDCKLSRCFQSVLQEMHPFLVYSRRLKDQYPFTAYAPNFDFLTGGREFKRCEK